MVQTQRAFALFPHTLAAEFGRCRLAFIASAVHCMQVLEPLEAEPAGDEVFVAFQALAEADEIEQVRRLLREYRRIGEVHDDPALMQVLVSDRLAREAAESRFAIQSRTRGKTAPVPEGPQALRREAAVLLELARDLDVRTLDLDRGLAQIESLEREFKEILGVTAAEELREIVETEAPPLTPDHGYLSYRLGKRMTSWWRLYAGAPFPVDPVYLALTREVVDELVETAAAVCARDGREPLQLELVRFPVLEELGAEAVSLLRRRLRTDGVLPAFHAALAELLQEPESPAVQDRLKTAAAALEGRLQAALAAAERSAAGTDRAVLTWLPEIDWRELWRRLDPAGHAVLSGGVRAGVRGLQVIHLESL